MEKSQKVILVVLILAIVFSVFSILICVNLFDSDFPASSTGNAVEDSGGGVQFLVETNSQEEGFG